MNKLLGKLFFAILTLGFASHAVAKTIIVTDIDDTLKVSHILNLPEMIMNAPKGEAAFLGTPKVLRSLVQEASGQNSLTPSEVQPAVSDGASASSGIFYVSNSLQMINKWVVVNAHQRFLKNNGFPKGPLLLREDFLDNTFKFREISKIISNQAPDRVILIGDNGEHDIEVYRDLEKEFPEVHFLIYIHMVYYSESETEVGKKLFWNQRPWVTALDLAMNLNEDGLLSDASVKAVAKEFLPALYRQDMSQKMGTLALPYWVDYRDCYTMAWPRVNKRFRWYPEYLRFLLERAASPRF